MGNIPHRRYLPMDPQYDAGYMRSFYDTYGTREWDRLQRDPTALVNFHIHGYYLDRFVRRGDHVLDVGAGPGRFTIELARLGATVVVGDLSPVQLDLNREKVRDAGYEQAVTARELMDIVDLSQIADASFDAVVCYGGPLSYVFNRADQAIDELLRVTKPNGYLLLSVMSLAGAMRRFLAGILALAQEYGAQRSIHDVLTTGNLTGDINQGHPMHLYRSEELLALLRQHACECVAASAANFLSPGNEAALADIVADETIWPTILAAEVTLCQQPGALDGGTHIIAVVKRR